MLSKLRKALRKNKELDNSLTTKRQKYYIENNYQRMPLFKYLLFLRRNKVNLNAFFDQYLKENDEKQ